MTVSAADIVNEALLLQGNNSPSVTGNVSNQFGGTTAGKAAAILYTPCVQAVGRQFGWDFARNAYTLVLSGNVAPYPWAYEYNYPPNGVEVWQVLPGTEDDPNNPLPVNYQVGNATVGGAGVRVIWTNLADAHVVYNNNPTEDTWDALFRAAVVRQLGAELAAALAGKPDMADSLQGAAGAFEKLGEGRQD